VISSSSSGTLLNIKLIPIQGPRTKGKPGREVKGRRFHHWNFLGASGMLSVRGVRLVSTV